MHEPVDGVTVASAVYEIGGRRLAVQAPEFADAIAQAHAAQQRPRCLCVPNGVEMYVARLAGRHEPHRRVRAAFGGGYIVKRMPETGSRHAPDCPSYEPPADASGLGQVLGSAIVEDPATGETRLKLDFPLMKVPGRSAVPSGANECGSVVSRGTRLSLRGLLHYLWDQADLTRWHPGFAGRRNWGTVRRHLLQAAAHKVVGDTTLGDVIYVPEPFFPEQSEAIGARRRRLWQGARAAFSEHQPLMVLIGEVKEIVPARYGFKAIVKHVPDQPLSMDAALYRQVERRFAAELALWGSDERIHMIAIATFGASDAGVAVVHELSLMPVTREWLPTADGFETELLARLVNEDRSFVKGLRYNLSRRDRIPSATLTDCGGVATGLFVLAGMEGEEAPADVSGCRLPAWTWKALSDPIPPLPARTRLASHRTPH